MANKYPTLFVHGFMGWGEDNLVDEVFPYFGFNPFKRFIPKLQKEGFEIYQPHVGPFNSAWDRACILWAYVMGGTVDFGKVHSEKYGHERYGRTYPGILKDWGEKGDHERLNIVGHSFGGPTVKTFLDLVAHGCQEEIDGTPAEELSDLFKLNKAQKIHCAVTLSGVNNGTSFASMWGDKGMITAGSALMKAFNFIGNSRAMWFYDVYLDQWHITSDPAGIKEDTWGTTPDGLKGIEAYMKNHKDSILMEMQVETQQEIMKLQSADDDAYMFACRANSAHKNRFGKWDMNRNTPFFLCKFAGEFTARYNPEKLKPYGFDETWFANDGLVNVKGQNAPTNQPFTDGDKNTDFKKGIWYNMPIHEGWSHTSWCGWGLPVDEISGYYREMLETFAKLPD